METESKLAAGAIYRVVEPGERYELATQPQPSEQIGDVSKDVLEGALRRLGVEVR
ncbi:hypothetical protein [Ferruginivarius sediminum]|uniref:hypothetical protein n=1 Tax=Ferruginivarius sediminum TaxID=2661937 RepID=UPI001293E5A4|nr:hypothetical protein [Ferruginivarius sediminum]